MNITGYRTNLDGSETLAWEATTDGAVICDHDARRACAACVDADHRLTVAGSTVIVGHWPAHAVRDGRTVRYTV